MRPHSRDGVGSAPSGPSATLVAQHLSLAEQLARQLRHRHCLQAPEEDLVAYARKGLVEAATRFDPGRGVPFAAYARRRIVGALWDGVRQMGWQPRRRHRAIFEQGANAYLQEVDGERPAGKAQQAGALEEHTSVLAVIYLAALDGTDDDVHQLPAETTGVVRRLERAQLQVGMARAFDGLPSRERILLEGMYRRGRLMSEMADELGLSLSWACRLHARAVKLLRDRLRAGGLIS